MRTVSLLIVSAALPVGAFAQITVGASLTIQDPEASCTVLSTTDLDYGTLIRPTTGSGLTIDMDEVDGTMTASTGLTVPTGYEVGAISVQAQNTSNLTISTTFPSDLDNLSYTGAWAISEDATSGYATITGTSHTVSGLGGVGGDATRYYRFGGEVGDIGSATALGTYDADISLAITCTQ